MFKNLTPAEYEVPRRHDFTTFAGRCFQDLNPQTCLATNWHLEVIAAKLTVASSPSGVEQIEVLEIRYSGARGDTE